MGEHREHEKLLDATLSDAQNYGALKQAIVHHVRVEEKIFFSELLKMPAVEQTIREAWEEHNLCMQLLQELDAEETRSKTWEAKLKVLRTNLLSHIQTEEEELFPKLRRLLEETYLEELTDKLKDFKYVEPTNEILYPKVPGSHKLPSECSTQNKD